MATIEFGGGPTLEQRQAFCAPKDGTQIPGYLGHIHGFLFRNGRTYGEQTHLLAQTYEFRNPIMETTVPTDRPPLMNELPDPTGDDKYTKNMIPGYTGYIPRKLFKFGGTYKNDCDVSIDRHITNFQNTMKFEDVMRNTVKRFPRQQVLNHDPIIRDHLNTYRDTHPLLPVLADSKRAPTEAPICTWDGFVPRVGVTDTGLGLCYRDGAERGFRRFHAETKNHFRILKQPIDINHCESSVAQQGDPISKRIYLNDGMIPKYTGWVHGKKYEFGMTYGDTTRACEVCSHDNECYGDFVKARGPTTTIVVS